MHFRKRADGSVFVAMTEDAEFSNGKVSKITRKAEDGRIIGNTQFQYHGNGLVSNIRHQEGTDSVTTITLSYTTSLDANNNLKIESFGANIEYSFSLMRHAYQAYLDGGVVVNDGLSSANGNWEEGLYQYDGSINPFYGDGWPDMQQFVIGKHNLEMQWKTYVNYWPPFEVYNIAYNYTPDGYPKEVLKSHRNARTHAHIDSFKEVYVY
ncbi:MAG: hypothetical protein NVV59_08790 [Chitinophagaceae bacterium]|nr:hypothetical protein [Chitinophagaceae bacterium]